MRLGKQLVWLKKVLKYAGALGGYAMCAGWEHRVYATAALANC